jgi:hypothetical protein
MLCFSIYAYTDSFGKALSTGILFFGISLFSAWRRLLEPVALFLFCLVVAHWCDPAIVEHVKTAVIGRPV